MNRRSVYSVWADDLVTAGIPALVGIAGIWGTLVAPAHVQRVISRRNERRAFRKARRLVLEELETIQMHFLALTERAQVPTEGVEHLLPTDAWTHHREVLAEALSDDDWAGLPTVMSSVELQRGLLQRQPPGGPLGAEALTQIGRAVDLVLEVHRVLQQAEPVDD